MSEVACLTVCVCQSSKYELNLSHQIEMISNYLIDNTSSCSVIHMLWIKTYKHKEWLFFVYSFWDCMILITCLYGYSLQLRFQKAFFVSAEKCFSIVCICFTLFTFSCIKKLFSLRFVWGFNFSNYTEDVKSLGNDHIWCLLCFWSKIGPQKINL